MTAARAGVIVTRKTVEEKLIRADTGGETGAGISVIRKEEICICTKAET
jgi:hypothetical protein